MSFHNNLPSDLCQKKYYNENYFSDKQCRKFSDMQGFDAAAYADWFSEHYEKSPYKSLSEVAEKVGVSRETVSRIAKGNKQLLTDNPSRPKLKLVDALSELFGRPIDEGRLAAGYAPTNTQTNDETAGIFRALKEIPPERKELALRQIKAIIKTHIDDEDFDFNYIDD